MLRLLYLDYLLQHI